MSTVKALVASIRSTVASQHAHSQARRQLEREIASYNTPTARADLEAILNRYPGRETREIENLLARQTVEHAMTNAHRTGF